MPNNYYLPSKINEELDAKCLKRSCLKFCVSFSFCQHESTTICVNQHEFSNDFSPLEWVCAHTDYQAGSHPGGIVLRCPNLSEPFRCVRAVLYSEVFTLSLTNRKTPFSSSALPSVTTHRSWPQVRVVKQTEWSVGSIALTISLPQPTGTIFAVMRWICLEM